MRLSLLCSPVLAIVGQHGGGGGGGGGLTVYFSIWGAYPSMKSSCKRWWGI